jgi:hypothetical protein
MFGKTRDFTAETRRRGEGEGRRAEKVESGEFQPRMDTDGDKAESGEQGAERRECGEPRTTRNTRTGKGF